MSKQDRPFIQVVNRHSRSGFVVLVMWIGAFVYFAQSANSFNDWAGAFFQAIVWPGILLFHVLKLVGA